MPLQMKKKMEDLIEVPGQLFGFQAGHLRLLYGKMKGQQFYSQDLNYKSIQSDFANDSFQLKIGLKTGGKMEEQKQY